MHPTDQQIIVLMMVFCGGFFIVFTAVMFVVFYRFLERERVAGERFREAHRARNKPDDGPAEE